MSGSVPNGFLPTAFSGPAWEQARRALAGPRDGESSLAAVRAETAVRDLLLRYVYALDQSDLDGVMAIFTDDCVMTSPTSAVTGTAAIRAHYEHVLGETRSRFHLLTNTVVRLAADLRSGQVSSYFFAVRQRDGELPHVLGGLFADQVVERAGGWKICARSIAIDVGFGIARHQPNAESTSQRSSG